MKYVIEVNLSETDPSEVLDAVIEWTGDEDATVWLASDCTVTENAR